MNPSITQYNSLKSSRWFNVVLVITLRGIGLLLQLAVNIFVARTFGPAGIGVFQLYNSWMVTITDAGGLGLPVSTMRRVSQLHAIGDKRSAYELTKKTLLLTATLFLILVGLGTTLFPWVLLYIDPNNTLPEFIYYALAGSLVFSFFRILVEARKAEGCTKLSVTFESIALPAIFLLACSLYVLCTESPESTGIVSVHIVVLVVITTIFFLHWLRSKKPLTLTRNLTPKKRVLQPDNLTIWGNVVVNAIIFNLPFYLLPVFSDPDSIGVFAVNYRIVAVSTSLLVVLSAWFGPRIAAAHTNADANAIRRELRQARIISTLVYLPFLLTCVLFGQNILAIFGDAFIYSTDILVILAIGQLVNSITGMPGLHLNMIGKSKLELNMALITLVIGAPLCLALGIAYGLIGLAIGFSATIALKNIGSMLLSEIQLRKTGNSINPQRTNSFQFQTQ